MHYQGLSSRGVFLTLQCPSLSVHICASVPISLCVCVVATYKQEGVPLIHLWVQNGSPFPITGI